MKKLYYLMATILLTNAFKAKANEEEKSGSNTPTDQPIQFSASSYNTPQGQMIGTPATPERPDAPEPADLNEILGEGEDEDVIHWPAPVILFFEDDNNNDDDGLSSSDDEAEQAI